jgi:hypothetical protein
VVLTFDSATNKGEMNEGAIVFDCKSLLEFVGIERAACQWSGNDQIVIYLTGGQSSSILYGTSSSLLNVGDNITFLSQPSLKAQCVVVDKSRCWNWSSIQSKVVKVETATSMSYPKVQISSPSILAPCQDLVLDLTGSSGNAGRNWESVKIVAQQMPKISENIVTAALNNYLARNYSFSPPSRIPSSLLVRGAGYNFKVTLCNFLGACSSSTRVVQIMRNESSIPLVSIAGSSYLQFYSRSTLQVKAVAYTQSCSGLVSTSSLTFNWSMTLLS